MPTRGGLAKKLEFHSAKSGPISCSTWSRIAGMRAMFRKPTSNASSAGAVVRELGMLGEEPPVGVADLLDGLGRQPEIWHDVAVGLVLPYLLGSEHARSP